MFQRPNPARSAVPALLLTLACMLALPCASRAQEPASPDPEPARLELMVALVGSDLTVTPVPKKRFLLEPQPAGDAERAEVLTLTSGFDGRAEVSVPPGAYLLRSAEPVELDGKRYSWSLPLELVAGGEHRVELSNDNADVGDAPVAPSPSAARTFSEGEIYQRFRDGVFKIEAEGGHGSGFLVDPEGLVVTNHHVVRGSGYLAVKIGTSRKHEAHLVAEDEIHDVAILRVHPAVVEGLPVLPLFDDDPSREPVPVGGRVVAIGSPLATETILTGGLVSKIEEGAIYSDVNINPGNSGGPLLTLGGEVIGINTFGLFSRTGPGVSGIVRIHVVRDLLEATRAEVASAEPPSARALPVEPEFRFAPETIREAALASSFKTRDYHVEAGKFDVQVLTPVLIASLELEGEKRANRRRKKRTRRKAEEVDEYVPGRDFYEWRRYVGDYKPVVVLQAIPEVRLTGGSAAAVFFLGAGVPKNYRFKGDFDRMELLRNNVPVEPIHPGRRAESVNLGSSVDRLDDIGYMGSYTYRPEAFAPGAVITLKVWEQGDPRPKVKILSDKLLGRIRRDLRDYYQAVGETEEAPAVEASAPRP